jgi:hypothetical protein
MTATFSRRSVLGGALAALFGAWRLAMGREPASAESVACGERAAALPSVRCFSYDAAGGESLSAGQSLVILYEYDEHGRLIRRVEGPADESSLG